MHEVNVRIQGITPYSQSRHHETPKLKGENSRDYEDRTWRERLNYDKDGMVFIPCTAIKNCLSDIAKYLSVQIPGKNKSTYTKHFEAGVIVADHLPLNVNKKDVVGEWVFVPADGRRGGTKRVSKCFGRFDTWGGEVKVIILDDTITREVFEQHIKEAGKYIGLGRFRPRNNGYYGRFSSEILEWK
jgi:hypothetical protein